MFCKYFSYFITSKQKSHTYVNTSMHFIFPLTTILIKHFPIHWAEMNQIPQKQRKPKILYETKNMN